MVDFQTKNGNRTLQKRKFVFLYQKTFQGNWWVTIAINVWVMKIVEKFEKSGLRS